MGLFDFAKNIGRKIFNKDKDDPAEKIKEHIEENNPGIDGLEVAYEDGKVTISGDASSADALEKAVLIAGNIHGVADVDASTVSAPVQTITIEYYEIKSGDTLSKIAKQFYGKASEYPRIFDANREVIGDPDLIFPGQKIRIPS